MPKTQAPLQEIRHTGNVKCPEMSTTKWKHEGDCWKTSWTLRPLWTMKNKQEDSNSTGLLEKHSLQQDDEFNGNFMVPETERKENIIHSLEQGHGDDKEEGRTSKEPFESHASLDKTLVEVDNSAWIPSGNALSARLQKRLQPWSTENDVKRWSAR